MAKSQKRQRKKTKKEMKTNQKRQEKLCVPSSREEKTMRLTLAVRNQQCWKVDSVKIIVILLLYQRNSCYGCPCGVAFQVFILSYHRIATCCPSNTIFHINFCHFLFVLVIKAEVATDAMVYARHSRQRRIALKTLVCLLRKKHKVLKKG